MTNISNELPAEENVSEEIGSAEDDAAQVAPDETVVAEEAAIDVAEQPASFDDAGAADADAIAEEAPAADIAAVRQPVSGVLLEQIVEGALLAAAKPLAVEDLAALFEDDERPTAQAIRDALAAIVQQSAGRGFELREVASGFRFQVIQDVAPWIARLWEEKPQKYSRALLETLALIAYRQPITRGDIEDIRGVAVATNIIKTLLERDWVRVVGHKDVPGRPAMYATTRRFLDYFNLKNLDELPALADLRDLDALSAQLSLEGADTVLPEQLDAEASAEESTDDQDTTVAAASDDTATAVATDAVAETDLDAELEADADSEVDSEADPEPQAEDAASTEAATDVEPLEPRPDAPQSED